MLRRLASLAAVLVVLAAAIVFSAAPASAQAPDPTSTSTPGRQATQAVADDASADDAATADAAADDDAPAAATESGGGAGESDALQNVQPSQLANSGGEINKYPVSRYGLDYKTTGIKAGITSGVDLSGVPGLLMFILSQIIWHITIYLVYAALAVFRFAFNFNLLTGPNNATSPISGAIRAMDQHVLGLQWQAVGVLVLALWAMYRALVQRRYAETVGSVGVSIALSIVAFGFVLQSAQIVNFASTNLDKMSAGFLSVGQDGKWSGDSEKSTQSAADNLWRLAVVEPYTVLQFGGLAHCAQDGKKRGDDQDDPISIGMNRCGTVERPNPPAGYAVRDNRFYAQRFLAYNAGDERRCCGDDEEKNEYSAIDKGDSGVLPKPDDSLSPKPKPYPAGQPSRADIPAVDFMQRGSQIQRLGFASIVALGDLGMVFMVAALSLAVILAQALFLLVLAFAALILIAAMIPGWGHEVAIGWLKRMAMLIAAKVWYSLIIAVVITVAYAIQRTGDTYGWLVTFGIQGAFFWTIFVYRNRLTELMTSSARGGMGRLALAYGGYQAARLGTRTVRQGGGTAARAAGRAAGGASTIAANPIAAMRVAQVAPRRAGSIMRDQRAAGASPARAVASGASAFNVAGRVKQSRERQSEAQRIMREASDTAPGKGRDRLRNRAARAATEAAMIGNRRQVSRPSRVRPGSGERPAGGPRPTSPRSPDGGPQPRPGRQPGGPQPRPNGGPPPRPNGGPPPQPARPGARPGTRPRPGAQPRPDARPPAQPRPDTRPTTPAPRTGAQPRPDTRPPARQPAQPQPDTRPTTQPHPDTRRPAGQPRPEAGPQPRTDRVPQPPRDPAERRRRPRDPSDRRQR